MAVELKVPSIGESVTEVILGEWAKSVGDFVRVDEDLVEVESDKSTMNVPAPVDGKIQEILKQPGDTANVGEVIALIDDSATPPAQEEAPASKPQSESTPEAPASQAASPQAPSQAPTSQPSAPPQPTRVMPAAGRALAEKGLAAGDVKATGPGGRLLKEDVLRHGSAPAGGNGQPSREVRSEPMSLLRQRIAGRLVEAQQGAALLTTFNEIDMSAVMQLRKEHQDAFVKRHGLKLGFMSFFVRATIDALQEYPAINARIDGRNIVYHDFYDIGIAIGGGRGLVVPVLRNAERLSFAGIEQTINDFAVRAKENSIQPQDLQGGTFTITNGGVYGSLMSTPIVNPPQSGVLGMHQIQERPVAIDGQVFIRPMMYVALTYDHRIVDGREAVTFLRHIKSCVEDPVRMLIDV